MLEPITGKQTETTNQNPLSGREDGLAPPKVHGPVEEGRCLNQIRTLWEQRTTRRMTVATTKGWVRGKTEKLSFTQITTQENTNNNDTRGYEEDSREELVREHLAIHTEVFYDQSCQDPKQ